jgi:hypothetical protein
MFDFLLFLISFCIWLIAVIFLVAAYGAVGFMFSLILALLLGAMFLFVTDN